MKDTKKMFTITSEISVRAVDEKTAIERLTTMLKRRGFEFKQIGKITFAELKAKPIKAKVIKTPKPVAKKEVDKKKVSKDTKKPVLSKLPSIGMGEEEK